MKKLVIFLIILVLLISGILFYQKRYETVECWWGVLYPSLSYIGFESDNQDSMISSTDKNFIYIANNDKIEYRFIIIDWLKEKFNWD